MLPKRDISVAWISIHGGHALEGCFLRTAVGRKFPFKPSKVQGVFNAVQKAEAEMLNASFILKKSLSWFQATKS